MRLNLDYIAGILDGEGYLGILWKETKSKRTAQSFLTPYFQVYVGMKRSDSVQRMLEGCQGIFGGSVSSFVCRGYPHIRWKILGRHDVERCLLKMKGRLVVKAAEAELVLRGIRFANHCHGPRQKDGRMRRTHTAAELLTLASMADRVAEIHARQVPRRWTGERVEKALRDGKIKVFVEEGKHLEAAHLKGLLKKLADQGCA